MFASINRLNLVGITLAWVLVWCHSANVSAVETIVDEELGFTLTLPTGFLPNADLARSSPTISHAFVCGDMTDSELDIFLFVEKMNGTISNRRLNAENAPAGFKGSLFTIQWQGFEVDAFSVPERVGNVEAITYNVQIPLRRIAVQLKLFGPVDRDAEIRKRLDEILASLHGESNWSRLGPQFDAFKDSESYGTVLLTIAIVTVVCGLLGLYVVSRIAPKGATLAFAGVIWLSSFAIDGFKSREMMLLIGVTRMIGFGGGLLGIVDLVRKRSPRAISGSSTDSADRAKPE